MTKDTLYVGLDTDKKHIDVGVAQALPRTRTFPRLTRLKIVIGPPMTAEELERRGAGTHPHIRIANALQEAVASLPPGT